MSPIAMSRRLWEHIKQKTGTKWDSNAITRKNYMEEFRMALIHLGVIIYSESTDYFSIE